MKNESYQRSSDGIFRHLWFQEASRKHTLESIEQHEKFAAAHESALGGEAFHRSVSDVGRAQHLQDIKDVNSLIAMALQQDISGPSDVCAFSAVGARTRMHSPVAVTPGGYVQSVGSSMCSQYVVVFQLLVIMNL